jgi:ABC-type transport system involved in multi-copper enzyme maturation permease subunit
VDFARILKDKLFLVACIVGGVFAFITPLMYQLIFSSLGGAETEEMLMAMGLSITAKSQFFDAFSLGNNFGLVLPVLISIIICKDFSQGTVRNKIIAGNTRTSIFISMLITCFCTVFGIILVHALLTMLVSLIFFQFQNDPFTAADFGNFMLSVAFEVILYIFVSALVCFLCAFTKNMGLAIVSYVAVIMIMSIVTSILQIAAMVFTEDGDIAKNIIDFLQNINVFNFSMVIGKVDKYSTEQILCCILSPLFGATALSFFGALKFNKKDLK